MAIFESGNPTLSEKIFSKNLDHSSTELMTVRGSIQKFGFLLLMVVGGAAYTWKLFVDGAMSQLMTLFWIGAIGGMATAFAILFKPDWAKYLAPAYGLLEGFFIGTLSVIVNKMFEKNNPNIVLQAVMLTFGVAIAVFLLYNFRIIKPTQKFKAIILSCSLGIGVFYLVYIVLGLFGVNIGFMNWGDNSLLGIGVNLFVAVIAALSLVLDFERLEVGEQMGAPKQMEWYGAFGLLVTLVWLYIQILQLLSRFSNNRN